MKLILLIIGMILIISLLGCKPTDVSLRQINSNQCREAMQNPKFDSHIWLSQNIYENTSFFVYVDHKLADSEFSQMQKIGISAYKASWIPPLKNHPNGFYLARAKISDICKLANVESIIQVDTAKGESMPQ